MELKAMKSDIYESNMQNNHNLEMINIELKKRSEIPTSPEPLA